MAFAVVHVVPLTDHAAVMVVPLRVSFSHSGPLAGALVDVATAEVALRCWNSTPLVGVISNAACLQFHVSDSRIITPAFAATLVLLWLVMRVVMDPSPVNMV